MTKAIGLQGYKGIIVFGTVEDLNDPEQLNRVKVRIPQHGSKGQTPADSLPWARTTIPAQGSGTNQGAGGSSGGLSVAKDATVMVLVNEDNHEDITVLGVLPVNASGKSGEHSGASAGGQSSMALGSLKDGTTGGKFEPKTEMSKKILNPAPASFPQKKGKYPDTHVNVSKTGFRTTFHDIPNETYKAEVHPTGTFTEMQADGNYVTYCTKDHKQAVDGEYTLGSEKNMVITTNGDLQLKVGGNLLIEVKGSMNEHIAASRSSEVGETFSASAKSGLEMLGGSSASFASKGTTFLTGSSAVQINSSAGKSVAASQNQRSKGEISSNIDSGAYAKK